MNRWMQRTMLFASLAGALAVVPGAVAFAHDAQGHAEGRERGHHGRHGGLLQAALKLDSLTAEQRASIEQLVAQRQAADLPVRQADAQVLTVLAQQVQSAAIDPQGLAPSLGAEQSAADAEAAVERDALGKLHSILSAAQRGQLVDRLAAHAAREGEHERTRAGEAGEEKHDRFGRGLDLTAEQKTEIRAKLVAGHPAAASPKGERVKMLEAFRGDTFDATSFVVAHGRGERMEKLAAAMVPVLTPAQRDTFATHLRERAAHESAPKGSR